VKHGFLTEGDSAPDLARAPQIASDRGLYHALAHGVQVLVLGRILIHRGLRDFLQVSSKGCLGEVRMEVSLGTFRLGEDNA